LLVHQSDTDVTALLTALADGDVDAMDRLIDVVYGELHRLAASHLHQERADQTLGPTALVHEAFLRLIGSQPVDWQGRAHFFGVASRIMRRILVDRARHRIAARRDRRRTVPLSEALTIAIAADEASDADVIGVHDALDRLAELDERQARMVELRWFAGFSISECAELLGVSEATVSRDWSLARAWLQRELERAS
jgi:RNA polymerase sigma factor (TIGR02999 family)